MKTKLAFMYEGGEVEEDPALLKAAEKETKEVDSEFEKEH